MKKQLSILGCGWLGFPLAKQLIKEGWSVKGSTTSASKLAELNSAEIQAYVIQLEEEGVNGDLHGFLEGSELLVINIPPGLRRNPNSNFVAKLKTLSDELLKSSLSKIIYVSSTGVFEDHESMPIYTEHYRFSPSEIKNSQLIQAEDLLLNLPSVKTSVIRLSGLVGKERHPVNFLSGRKGLKNPDSPVNLIHLDNCILLISEIIKQEKFGMVFHGNEDLEVSKQEYYSQKAKDLKLSAPEFDLDSTSKGKKISMEWTAQELGVSIPLKV